MSVWRVYITHQSTLTILKVNEISINNVHSFSAVNKTFTMYRETSLFSSIRCSEAHVHSLQISKSSVVDCKQIVQVYKRDVFMKPSVPGAVTSQGQGEGQGVNIHTAKPSSYTAEVCDKPELHQDMIARVVQRCKTAIDFVYRSFWVGNSCLRVPWTPGAPNVLSLNVTWNQRTDLSQSQGSRTQSIS